MAVENDLVNHPRHYTRWPVEVIEITRHLSFDLGNAVKYILRHQLKGTPRQDIEKAMWYLSDISNGGLGVSVEPVDDISLEDAIVWRTRDINVDPFPHRAVVNLTKLLVADSRLEDRLDGYVVNALLSLADGDIRLAKNSLTAYLDNLRD